MTKEYPWMLGPFEKAAEANPCLVPNTVSRFFCPVQEKELGWEAKDVFNPAAVVKDDRVYLLYRAEDHEGKYAGTSPPVRLRLSGRRGIYCRPGHR